MQGDHMCREELMAELTILRRRVEQLEAENSSLRQQKPPGNEGSVHADSDRMAGVSLFRSPDVRVNADITKRKRAEQELRFTQFAVDNSIDAAFWISSDGRHVYVNHAACRSLGYSREELLGLSVQDIDPTFSPERWNDHWRETKERGSCVIETRHKRKDGRSFPVEVRINFFEFEGEEYQCTFACDITDRKKAEQALQESVEKFRTIVENSLAGIFTVDEAYRFIYVNEEMCRLTGYSEDSLLNSDFRNLLTDESLSFVVDRYIRRQKGEQVPSVAFLN